MIIVTSERTKRSNRKDQEGEAKETIYGEMTKIREGDEAKGRKKIVARELRSPT